MPWKYMHFNVSIMLWHENTTHYELFLAVHNDFYKLCLIRFLIWKLCRENTCIMMISFSYALLGTYVCKLCLNWSEVMHVICMWDVMTRNKQCISWCVLLMRFWNGINIYCLQGVMTWKWSIWHFIISAIFWCSYRMRVNWNFLLLCLAIV